MLFSAEEKELIRDYCESCNWQVSFPENGGAVIMPPNCCMIKLSCDQNGAYILTGKSEVFQNFPIGTIKLDTEKYKVKLILIDVLERIAQAVRALQLASETKNAVSLADYWNDISQMEETERAQWSKGRVGQDKLRNYLLTIHGGCQITGISRKELLIASHIKPWRDCSDKKNEGLDPENILLLAKNYDAFFDAALISFSPDTGKLIVSPLVTKEDLDLMGINCEATLPRPSPKQAEYLKWHNELLKKRSVPDTGR